MTVGEYRRQTRGALEPFIGDEARTVTDILLAHFLGTERSSLLARLGSEAPAELSLKLNDAVNRLSTGVPVQYVIGYCYFYGLKVAVGPGCFIPRGDTETLAKAAIALLKGGGSFVELCSGSGCVSMAIAENIKGVRGAATELSLKALSYAEKNLLQYPNVKTKRVDVLEPDELLALSDEWGEGFDLLVCNPPYVPTADIQGLSPQVQYEPETALDGGENGLKFYRYIIANADLIMKEKHKILFEVGVGQAPPVAQMLSVMGYATAVFRDLGGIDRVVLGDRSQEGGRSL